MLPSWSNYYDALNLQKWIHNDNLISFKVFLFFKVMSMLLTTRAGLSFSNDEYCLIMFLIFDANNCLLLQLRNKHSTGWETWFMHFVSYRHCTLGCIILIVWNVFTKYSIVHVNSVKFLYLIIYKSVPFLKQKIWINVETYIP